MDEYEIVIGVKFFMFDIFRKKYDMDSIDGIKSIPVPTKNYKTGNDLNDCIYYLLQKKQLNIRKMVILIWLLNV